MNDFSSKKAIKAAARAKAARDSAAAAQAASDAKKSRPQCLKELVETGLLQKQNGETIMGALQRLGEQKKKLVKAKPKRSRSNKGMDVDSSDDGVTEITRQINQLTSLASTLLDLFNETDVYEETYDSVVKTLRLEGEVPRVSFPSAIPSFSAHVLSRVGNQISPKHQHQSPNRNLNQAHHSSHVLSSHVRPLQHQHNQATYHTNTNGDLTLKFQLIKSVNPLALSAEKRCSIGLVWVISELEERTLKCVRKAKRSGRLGHEHDLVIMNIRKVRPCMSFQQPPPAPPSQPPPLPPSYPPLAYVPPNATPLNNPLFGPVPASISHERERLSSTY